MIDKKKYIITIITVLIIGFVLGFLINGRLTRAKINRMQNFFTEQGFNGALVRIIQPTPEQMKQIKPILRKYARKNRRRIINMHQAQMNSFDSLEMEIKPFLTEKQIKRFEHVKLRHRNMMFLKHHRVKRFKK